MKIIRGTKAQTSIQVVLLREAKAAAGFLVGKQETAYAEKHLTEDRSRLHLNHMDEQVFLIRLDATKKGKDLTANELKEAARKSGKELQPLVEELKLGSLCIHNSGVSEEECLAFAEGLALSTYQFLKYFTGEKSKAFALKKILLDIDREDEILKLQNLVNAVWQTRDLVNEPLSYLTAEQLATEIDRMGGEAGFGVEVFNKKKIESLKMGGLLAVNKGSVDPPSFSILSWKPDGAVNDKPLILVGKGVVFDTGGLSLKPTADSMDYMKCDMGGAATVAGTFYALAKNKLPLWVIGLIPATDNRPDGNAYVPGDVIRMYNGSTVEVLNTDAEGRMILADALSYASQYNPELVIDVATLTGSAMMAIGNLGIVAMGNAGKEVMEQLKESGAESHERIAELPFWDEYSEELKSDIADLKNIGGRSGGAITAGKFLEHFTDYPYVHLDIAGPAYNKQPYSYHGKGGSGIGVRLLHDFLWKKAAKK